jgi:hypothetical protein
MSHQQKVRVNRLDSVLGRNFAAKDSALSELCFLKFVHFYNNGNQKTNAKKFHANPVQHVLQKAGML